MLDVAPFTATIDLFPVQECDNPDTSAGISIIIRVIIYVIYVLENLKSVWKLSDGKAYLRKGILGNRLKNKRFMINILKIL